MSDLLTVRSGGRQAHRSRPVWSATHARERSCYRLEPLEASLRMKLRTLTVSAAVAAGSLLGVVPSGPAVAATPTCDWVASYAGAWVPMYKATNTVTCNLVQGTHSAAVRQLQHSMNLCYGEKLAEDSDFGPSTRAALIRTQQKAGTPADGEYGPNTRKAMLHEKIGGGCTRVP